MPYTVYCKQYLTKISQLSYILTIKGRFNETGNKSKEKYNLVHVLFITLGTGEAVL